MSQYILSAMSESFSSVPSAPVTGDPVIDKALADAAAASELDLDEQAKRLGDAQSILAEVLRASRQGLDADRVA